MAKHIDTGKAGEDIAVEWLQQNGFVILERNWKSGRTELDVIATRNSELHIIENKTRTTETFGFPEGRITKNKVQRIAEAATKYIEEYIRFSEFIIDVLSIKINEKSYNDFFLIEDIRL